MARGKRDDQEEDEEGALHEPENRGNSYQPPEDGDIIIWEVDNGGGEWSVQCTDYKTLESAHNSSVSATKLVEFSNDSVQYKVDLNLMMLVNLDNEIKQPISGCFERGRKTDFTFDIYDERLPATTPIGEEGVTGVICRQEGGSDIGAVPVTTQGNIAGSR